MKLLTGPLSMFGRKVEIALAEKGLAHERVMVPFSMEHFYDPVHPDVARINPKRQVPVLIHDGLELWDSTLIFEYLEELEPRPALWPDDRVRRAEARQLELYADEVFFEAVQRFMPHHRAGHDAAALASATHTIQQTYANLDDRLAPEDHICGSFGYADITYRLGIVFATMLGHPPPELEALAAWTARMDARPSVSKALQEMQLYLADAMTPVLETQ